LVAILIEATATLTDEILDLHHRMIGSFFAKAKNPAGDLCGPNCCGAAEAGRRARDAVVR